MAKKCATFTPKQRLSPTLGDVSDVTIKDCPDDMPKLTRQWAHLQMPSAGHQCPRTGNWKSEDPFAPGNAIGDLAVDGPPTSEAQVTLPLRPKITLQSADSAEPRTLNDNDLPMSVDSMESSAIVTDQPKASAVKVQVCEWSDIEMPPHKNPSFGLETASLSGHNAPPVTRPDAASIVGSETAVRPERTICEVATENSTAPMANAGHDHSRLDALSNENTPSNVDDARKHDAYEPSIDGSDQDIAHGSFYRKSSVIQIYELLTKNQDPGPKRMATGVGSSNTAAALWTFRPWNSSPPYDARKSLEDAIDTSPRPRRESSDLEVEPSESGRSPETCSTVSARDHGESPMPGDRVEFDLGRAERTKRYAALTDIRNRDGESEAVVSEDMDSALALSVLRSETKNEAGTKEGSSSGDEHSPPKARSRHDLGNASCYSMDSDLQADLAGICELQNPLSGTTFDPNPVTVECSGSMTPTPFSTQVLLRSDAGSADEEPQSTSSYLASSPSKDTPALSPGETKFWREVQSCPFDTPQQSPSGSPSVSLHQRQSTATLSAMPYIGEDSERADDADAESAHPCTLDKDLERIAAQEDMPPTDPEQTLDEGLELYHSYTSNTDMRYSDIPTASSHGIPEKNGLATPNNEHNPGQSSDPDDGPLSPGAYRGVKTTVVSPPR
ncbi:hypothetical protein DOTSEDRAFT_46557 [Dothistroma septosporum NZE10]|uniref:Uncharacterized protein n=1 Tax=Dothistroma septosporum (strain NZE10 / CBS 128990) TaxID=675120 RepID=N1PHH7_DOTSN|nr:hypothetical protein DOTSEDRAFT_46557 [Dothistroma septosporum NZE10]